MKSFVTRRLEDAVDLSFIPLQKRIAVLREKEWDAGRAAYCAKNCPGAEEDGETLRDALLHKMRGDTPRYFCEAEEWDLRWRFWHTINRVLTDIWIRI